MELNTPNKNQTTSTPLSQFEDSPVFNYINNLSPIELVKSQRSNDQTFNLLSFSSPLPVFTSPQLNFQRYNQSFIRRCQFSDPPKPELSQNKDDNNTSEGISEGVKVSDLSVEQSGCSNFRSLANEFTTEPSNEHLEIAIKLPKALKGECSSPENNTGFLNAIGADAEAEVVDNPSQRHSSYESEKGLHKICPIEQNEDEAGCDWVTLISNAADTLSSDSSLIEEHPEEQKVVDPGTISFIANVLQPPHDNTKGLENMESVGRAGPPKQSEMIEIKSQSTESGQKDADQTSSIPSGHCQDKMVVDDATANLHVKEKTCSQSSCKQHKIRRRCLVFEMGGAHKKKPLCNSNPSSSISSMLICEAAHVEKHSTPTMAGTCGTGSMLSGRGIGLHLNALATASTEGKAVKIEILDSRRQEISQTPFEIDSSPCDNEDKVTENTPQTLVSVGEGFDISSPKMKRHKLEHVGAACTRCNCKRSKCLKLYCECFAAGLYCIEPCACHDCFNKPSYEETVLETRKRIESRNPLAFAPKVIRSTESASEFGDETKKTPASARHKRGCNCKKSSCLKKYCECFQGGVGCSSNCRCEGCKNSFGSKNGFDENQREAEESESHDKCTSDITSHDTLEKGEEEHPIPSESDRSPIQPIPFTEQFSGSSRPAIGPAPSTQACTSQKLGTIDIFFRRSKFEMHLPVIPEDETSDIHTSKCSPTSGVKSTSPNCKRVSPPHHGFSSSATWRSRKLILRSIPPFPSLNSPGGQ